MIDFSTLQGLTIPEGVVTKIEAGGVVLWELKTGGGPVILEVKKIASDTYANETTYKGENFILLDIYPKTNGTVSVTYGSLTKTVTDTSGAEKPNAIKVFFGTFYGVPDEVETPESGTLTIDGDCYAFSQSTFKSAKTTTSSAQWITEILSFGGVSEIPESCFYKMIDNSDTNTTVTNARLPASVQKIGGYSFCSCEGITEINIPSNAIVGAAAFSGCKNVSKLRLGTGVTIQGFLAFGNMPKISTVHIPNGLILQAGNPFGGVSRDNILTVDSNNPIYKIEGNALIDRTTNHLISGFNNSIIPEGIVEIADYAFHSASGLSGITLPESVTTIGPLAFFSCSSLTDIVVPSGVTSIGADAFSSCTKLEQITIESVTPPTLGGNLADNTPALVSIIVPLGCSETYKTAEGWSTYADYIVEAS